MKPIFRCETSRINESPKTLNYQHQPCKIYNYRLAWLRFFTFFWRVLRTLVPLRKRLLGWYRLNGSIVKRRLQDTTHWHVLNCTVTVQGTVSGFVNTFMKIWFCKRWVKFWLTQLLSAVTCRSLCNEISYMYIYIYIYLSVFCSQKKIRNCHLSFFKNSFYSRPLNIFYSLF